MLASSIIPINIVETVAVATEVSALGSTIAIWSASRVNIPHRVSCNSRARCGSVLWTVGTPWAVSLHVVTTTFPTYDWIATIVVGRSVSTALSDAVIVITVVVIITTYQLVIVVVVAVCIDWTTKSIVIREA